MDNLNNIAKTFADLILSSSNVVAFTGAGISTESGIPDYRSPDTGLWEKMDQSVVSLDGFKREPSRYYDYSLELYPVRKAAKPNSAHYLLAELENRGVLKGIITQNVDGLHQDAGSGRVYELHGSLRQAVCLGCSTLQSMDEAMERVVLGQNPPLCTDCGGVLKPNAVFFGGNTAPNTLGALPRAFTRRRSFYCHRVFPSGFPRKYPPGCRTSGRSEANCAKFYPYTL